MGEGCDDNVVVVDVSSSLHLILRNFDAKIMLSDETTGYVVVVCGLGLNLRLAIFQLSYTYVNSIKSKRYRVDKLNVFF